MPASLQCESTMRPSGLTCVGLGMGGGNEWMKTINRSESRQRIRQASAGTKSENKKMPRVKGLRPSAWANPQNLGPPLPSPQALLDQTPLLLFNHRIIDQGFTLKPSPSSLHQITTQDNSPRRPMRRPTAKLHLSASPPLPPPPKLARWRSLG